MASILVVDELFYPLIGGTQSRTKNFAEKWIADGHIVSLLVIDHLGDLPTEEAIYGINVIRLYKDAKYYKNGKFGRKISAIFPYAFKVVKYINQSQNFDIIIFNQFPILPAILYKYLGKKNIPTLLDFVEFREGKFWSFLQKVLFKSVDKVAAISDYIHEQVKKHNTNSIVIPNSVDDFKHPVCLTPQNYIFVGRIEPHKHLEDAIKSVLLLENTNKLHIVGEGMQYEELRSKYESNRIVFHGFLSEQAKNTLLASCKILILPSEREGLPTVVIEAMMSGIPVVTTNYPNNGTRHFVNKEKNGLVAEPNIEDIANKILTIERDYEVYRNNCLEAKHKFNLTENSLKLLKFAQKDAI